MPNKAQKDTILRELEQRGSVVAELMEHVINTKCVDRELIRRVDRVARHVLFDIHPAWVRWGFYTQNNLFSGTFEQRFAAYEQWAKDNCDSFVRTADDES